jgi:hypothetical protein
MSAVFSCPGKSRRSWPSARWAPTLPEVRPEVGAGDERPAAFGAGHAGDERLQLLGQAGLRERFGVPGEQAHLEGVGENVGLALLDEQADLAVVQRLRLDDVIQELQGVDRLVRLQRRDHPVGTLAAGDLGHRVGERRRRVHVGEAQGLERARDDEAQRVVRLDDEHLRGFFDEALHAWIRLPRGRTRP